MKRRVRVEFSAPSQSTALGRRAMVNGVLLLFFCVAAGDGGSWQLALAPALAFVSLLSPLGTVRGFQFCAFRVTWLNLCTAAWGEKRVRERD